FGDAWKSAFADGATTFEEALAGLNKNKNQNALLQNTRSKLNTTLLEPGKDTLGPMLRNFEKSEGLTDDDDDDGLLQLRPKKMAVNIQKYKADIRFVDEKGHVYERVRPTTEQLLRALSAATTQGFKKVLNVNDEDVDKLMRQLRAEAQQLQHNKLELDHVPSSSTNSCSFM
nr:hypothetical protein [Tanacetum cinerariifolium]